MLKRAVLTALLSLMREGDVLAQTPASIWVRPSSEQMAAAQQATEARERLDWPYLARYRAENAALPPPDPQIPRVVFLGDSITEVWKGADPAFFAKPGYVNRGVGGQTTPQMLVRFRADVIDLKPRLVHIMAGTNDIAGNTGPEDQAQIENNLMTMVELARAHHIRVVLGSVPPASEIFWRAGQDPIPRIAALNAWIKAYAAREGVVYADYYAVLTDGAGGMRPAYSRDGVHPTPAGYAVMEAVTEAALQKALR